MAPVIRELSLDDVPSAAALLVGRHASHLVSQPLLGPLDQVAAERAVSALLSTDGAAGLVAVEGGVVVGYLIGTSKDGAAWGSNAWVEAAGCAGQQLRDLYAVAASTWRAEGRTAHYALVPPALADPFFWLAFGVQQVHAARPVDGPVAVDPRVRPAEQRDVEALAHLDVRFDEHFQTSPVFSAAAVSTYEERLADWQESFGDPDYPTFVAEVDGVVVGSAVACDVAKSPANAGLVSPERAAFLGFASVAPEARGLGLGRALGEAVRGWAADEGYPTICTDWRSTNLTADRTWRALGYEPTFLRLHRHLGY